jgi:predicted GTPase
MAASIGTECAEFVNEEFRECKELKIVALGTKMDGVSISGAPSQEIMQVCDEVLSSIAEYESTTGVQMVHRSIKDVKHNALVLKGAFVLENDPTRAIELFEEGREIMLEMGINSDDGSVFGVDALIAQAKTCIPGADKEAAFETVLQHRMHIFELSKDTCGEGDCRTLSRGLFLADTLIELGLSKIQLSSPLVKKPNLPTRN